MSTSQQINWIAGLLEGEGTFGIINGSFVIRVGMTDLDVIERFRTLTKTTDSKITVSARDGFKTMYITRISGNLAIQWMMTAYSLMGIRRKEKIREIIGKWKTEEYKEANYAYREKYKERINAANRKYNETRLRRNSIKALASARKISLEEAEKIMDSLMNGTVQ